MLESSDRTIFDLIQAETRRQKEVLELIPSENYASPAVLEALGSVLNNKYSEGYPKKRYYQGNAVADEVELLAQERAKKLFGVPYVNVQALSGAPANTAVYMALLSGKSDKIMGLNLSFGGHLTHGASMNFSSRFFTAVNYQLGKDALLDYEAIEVMAIEEKPKIIVCGFTAYPRTIDFARFAEIADRVGAYLLADVSHISGLIVAGVHPSPVPYAHIITTTTHKTLRGPRGALIMVTDKGIKKNPDVPRLIDSAIIPGLQGGPHDNQTAAIAVALKEAATPAFRKYGAQIVKNSKALSRALTERGFQLVSGGSDNHLILIDLRNFGVNGAVAAYAMELAGIVLNKNTVPFETNPPFYPSGIRLGTPAVTTRGMKETDMAPVADWMREVIDECKTYRLPEDREARREFMKKTRTALGRNTKLRAIAREVKAFCSKFPVP